MASPVVRRWTTGDKAAAGLLRRLVSGDASAAETAEALFALDVALDGDFLAEALHIAAETTTDGDVEGAVDLWRALLGSVADNEPEMTEAGRNESAFVSFSRLINVTRGVKVPV